MVTSKNVRFAAGQQVELTLTGPRRGLEEKTTGRLVTGLPLEGSESVYEMLGEVWEGKRPAPTIPLLAEVVVGNTFRGLLKVRLLNLEEYLAS